MAKINYADRAALDVTESAANTLTYDEITFATQLETKYGLLVHRIEYRFVTTSLALLIAANDSIRFGISTSNALTSLEFTNPELVDWNELLYDAIALGGTWNKQNPIIKDYTGFPGGGIFCPMKRLYAWLQGSSIASATQCKVRLWYTMVKLSDSDYIQLAEAFNVLT